MARYPQGVSSFIPTYQAYEPDFTTMGKMLSIKQNQYDQNWKQLNNIYSSLYFSNTSHGESQKVKDQLKNEIDFNIKRISGLDLSLDQNVQTAQQVFQPFYQNKNLMYDMAATKNLRGAMAQGMSYQSSTKAEEQNLFWQDGLIELDYKLKDFQNTPYDQIQSTGLAQATYTPYVDIGKMAESMAKEFGDRTTKSTSTDGKYEITTTNGPSTLMQPLAQLYQFRMGNDPRVQAMYKTQAYVDRKNWSVGHAGEYGGDINAAERAYLENEFKTLQGGIKKTNVNLKNNENSYNQMQSLLQDALNSGTASPDAERILNQVLTNKDITATLLNVSNYEKDMVTEGSSNGNTSTGNQVIFDGDINVLRNRVDLLRANSLMMQDFDKAAYLYSQRNMKTETKADPYAIAEFKENLKVKTQKSLAKDAFNVKSGTHAYDADGNTYEIKARNDWQSEGPVGGVTSGETNLRDFANTGINSEWSQIKPGLSQGLNIAMTIGIENSSKANKITKTLNRGRYINKDGKAVNKDKKLLTLANVNEALNKTNSPDEFTEQTGLDFSDITTLNLELLDLMTNDETVSTLIDNVFQTEADKAKIINWRKEAIKDKILLKGIYAEKQWLSEATNNLLNNASKSNGVLRNAVYAVDRETGAFGSSKEYYDNALDAILEGGIANGFLNKIGLDKDYLKKYLDDERRYAADDKRLDKSAAKNWNKGNYLSYAKDKAVDFFNLNKDFGDLISPDNIIGELLREVSVADYGDVKIAWEKEWKKARNFKKAPPSSFGTGTGISSMPASAIVTPANQGARPTQDFYGHMGKVGIYDDYMNIKGLINPGTELSLETPIMYSGVGTGTNVLDNDINTAQHQTFVKNIWDMHNDRNIYKDGSGFTVKVLPTTGISGNKAAYTIMPSKDILDEIIPTGVNEDEKILFRSIKADLLTNGATVISDRGNFDSYAFEASSTNPIQASLKREYERSGNAIVTETIDIEPGYGMDYTYNNNTKKYSINHRYKDFDLNTYLSKGTLVNSSVPLNLQNGETLYTQFNSFLTSTMSTTKSAVQERVNLVRNLKNNNPNITDSEIRQIFNSYNFTFNL